MTEDCAICGDPAEVQCDDCYAPLCGGECYDKHCCEMDGRPDREIDRVKKKFETERKARISVESQLEDEEEAAMKSGGILSDVCDVLFRDETRALTHGYEGVLDRAKELVGRVTDLEQERIRIREIAFSTKPDLNGMGRHQLETIIGAQATELVARSEEVERTRNVADAEREARRELEAILACYEADPNHPEPPVVKGALDAQARAEKKAFEQRNRANTLADALREVRPNLHRVAHCGAVIDAALEAKGDET